MRKIVVGAFVSLDGVMQAPGAPQEDRSGAFRFGGWTFPLSDESTGQFVMELFQAPFDLLLGRKTYEIFAAYWPYQSGPIADPFNTVTKFVATSSPEPLAWHNSVAISRDVPAELARLKQEDGPQLVVQGSSVLNHSLFAHRLVDELRLLIYPVILGRGKRLFDESSDPSGMKLVDSRTSSSGVILARYLPDGEVRTGSFAVEEPSKAELARRANWEQE